MVAALVFPSRQKPREVNRLATRLIFAVMGAILGASLAKYLGYDIGDLFSFSTDRDWEASVIIFSFMFGFSELSVRLFEPPENTSHER